MKANNISAPPDFIRRVLGVWNRHYRVYTKHIISNGLPPFLEPIIFLAGIGLGLQGYIKTMAGIPYIQFLAIGLLIASSMFTAAFECSFGTYIRLKFDKVYDGILAAPVDVNSLIIGEILWAGTKGFFFSAAVLIVMSIFGVLSLMNCILAPFVGFLTGLMFAVISLTVTSFVKDINQFNFYFTGFLSPQFFFSGIVFPIDDLPRIIRPLTELLPLTHSVRLVRAISLNQYMIINLYDLLYMFSVITILGIFAIKRLHKVLID